MKVIVDADACPVKNIIIKISKKYDIPVFMVTDTSHYIDDNYSKHIIVDKGADSVDFFILNMLKENEIVVTQDYGLASLVLLKNAYAINQNGLLYTNENIEMLLFQRDINKKIRTSNSNKKISSIPKRNKTFNKTFEINFTNLILEIIN